MDPFDSFIRFISEQFAAPSMGVQLGILVIAGTVGWFAQRQTMDYAAAHTEVDGMRGLLLEGARRLVWPLCMLILVAAGRGIMLRLHWPTTLLNVAIPLLASMAAIRALIYLLNKSITPSAAMRAWENVIATIVWIVVALHLVGWLPETLDAMDELAFTVGKARISLLALFKLTVAVAILLLLALWIARIIESKLNQSQHLDAGTRVGLAKFSKIVLLTLALFVALNSVGIDLTALTVIGGALSVGLGFGLQRLAGNIVSGYVLIFERSIRPADVVTVGQTTGEVKQMHARYVVVRSRDGVETLIPNETFITTDVVNWTYSDRKVRVKVPMQISYKDDPEQAMRVMEACGRANPRVIADPAPTSLISGFGDNGIHLELQVWILDPEEGMANVRSEIYVALWHEFKKHNITIPFPQREIFFKNPAPHGANNY